jgi:hypothetical protein
MNKPLHFLAHANREMRTVVMVRFYAARQGNHSLSLEDFAKANALPWPETLNLISDNKCPQKLRDSIMRMEATQ